MSEISLRALGLPVIAPKPRLPAVSFSHCVDGVDAVRVEAIAVGGANQRSGTWENRAAARNEGGFEMRSPVLAAIAAVSLVTASSAAIAQTAAPATPVERSGANLDGENQLRGTTKWIVGAIALALLIWGLIEILNNDDDDAPVSP